MTLALWVTNASLFMPAYVSALCIFLDKLCGSPLVNQTWCWPMNCRPRALSVGFDPTESRVEGAGGSGGTGTVPSSITVLCREPCAQINNWTRGVLAWLFSNLSLNCVKHLVFSLQVKQWFSVKVKEKGKLSRNWHWVAFRQASGKCQRAALYHFLVEEY